MKRIISLLLCLSMLFALAACGSSESDTSAAPSADFSSKSASPSGNDEQPQDDPGNAADDSSVPAAEEPAASGLVGTYSLDIYYNPDPFISWQYPDLRSNEFKTGEAPGALVLNADGTGHATYPGGDTDLKWDDENVYIGDTTVPIWFSDPMLIIEFEDGESLTYVHMTNEEYYTYRIETAINCELADEADYTVGEPYIHRWNTGKGYMEVIFPVTNNGDKPLILDDVYYTVLSPSGEEIDYRAASCYTPKSILPGETGFLFDHALGDAIPEDAGVKADIVHVFFWTGPYERFEVRDTARNIELINHSMTHRPTGIAVIPEGTDVDYVILDVMCLDKDGKLLCDGRTVNFPSSSNPYNFMEIPEGGGDAPFKVNMDGIASDPTFDQNLIDQTLYIAYYPHYYQH